MDEVKGLIKDGDKPRTPPRPTRLGRGPGRPTP
jgi:hypothetical protein